MISLDRGRCTLRALPGVLTLLVEAPDEDTLRRVMYPIGARLVGIGRREHLTVTWTPARSAGEQPVETPASGDSGHKRRRR